MSTMPINCNNSSVLVVDDEPSMRIALRANFLRYGWHVEMASGVREAARAFELASFDLVVTDVRMRDGDGFDVMCSVLKDSPNTAVILLTAFGSVPEAVESMRNGAFDYLTKPVSFEQLQAAAARVMKRINQPSDAHRSLELAKVPETMTCGIVGRSPSLLHSLKRARAAASTDADVLVEAESGTGKELLARFIHLNSARSRKPFIAVNCAAVPDSLLESELFGHAKGAFTGASAAKIGKFELANGGTLLLDEIGEMPVNLQPKLLRILQEREFERLGETRSIRIDIRVIATTNASLSTMVEEGRFRSDLFYRLNVIPLSIPPLRQRLDDIPLLASHFAQRYADENKSILPVLDTSFIERLRAQQWPGNIREMGNFIRRVLSLNRGTLIDSECFDREFQPLRSKQAPRHPFLTPGTPISVLERVHLENTLALARGNRTHAAEMLGISIRTMRNKIREYGLPPRTYA